MLESEFEVARRKLRALLNHPIFSGIGEGDCIPVSVKSSGTGRWFVEKAKGVRTTVGERERWKPSLKMFLCGIPCRWRTHSHRTSGTSNWVCRP